MSYRKGQLPVLMADRDRIVIPLDLVLIPERVVVATCSALEAVVIVDVVLVDDVPLCQSQI